MLLKNIKRVKAKGHVYYYHRPSKVRLPDIHAPDFMEAYGKLEAARGPARPDGGHGSVADLIRHYRRSSAFTGLADKTRKDYDRYLDWVHNEYGDLPVTRADREWVLELKDLFQTTPRKADYLIAVVSRILRFSIDFPSRYGLLHNPALKAGKLHKTDGYEAWPDELIERFRKDAYTELRNIVEAGLATGQRESDVVRMSWSHIDGEGIQVAQQKTGHRLWVPIHKDFRPILDGIKRTDTVIFLTKTGRPWTTNHLRHEIADHCAAYGFPGYSYHGLRKRAGKNLAEQGASARQIMDVLGLQTLQMAEKYTKHANQRTMASSAVALLPVKQKRKRKRTDRGKQRGKPDR